MPSLVPADGRRIGMLVATLLLLARSFAPEPGNDRSVDPVSGCSVALIRRTSRAVNSCAPLHGSVATLSSTSAASPQRMQPRNAYWCENEHSVVVTGGCSGLFQCTNGATTICTMANPTAVNRTCTCTGERGKACHHNAYTRSNLCPPAQPFPPEAPPTPPHPPFSPRPPARPPRPPRPPSYVDLCDRW